MWIFFLLLLSLSGCAKKGEKSVDSLGKRELKEEAFLSLHGGNNSRARACFEALVTKHPDDSSASQYRLILGDLHFNRGDYAMAGTYYKSYQTMNPARGEYAGYRSILSDFYQTFDVERDAQALQATLDRCAQYLERDEYKRSKYAKDVRDIQYTCKSRLVDREIYVFNFYLKRKKFKSAERRLVYLKKNVLPEHQSLAPRLMYLEAKLALAKCDDKRALLLQRELHKAYSDTSYSLMTDKLLASPKVKRQIEA